jgi:hypothetical protein
MPGLSTPLNQIRNMSNNQQLQPPVSHSTQDMNQPLQMPIYNPNIPPENPTQDNQQLQQVIPDNLMPNQNINNGSNLVDDLLNELESQPEYQQDMNIAQTQYAMDNVNTPPARREEYNNMLTSENSRPVSVNDNSHLLNAKSFDNDDYNFQSSKTLSEKVMDDLKPCLIVFVLFVLFSLHQVNRVIFSFLPQLLLENGQLSLYAILLKAFLATLLYYGFKRLL